MRSRRNLRELAVIACSRDRSDAAPGVRAGAAAPVRVRGRRNPNVDLPNATYDGRFTFARIAVHGNESPGGAGMAATASRTGTTTTPTPTSTFRCC